MIKSIDTKYKGYNFRSRLEARWAVYFDYLKLKWEYEKEGFEFIVNTKKGHKIVRYLPDFWLPELEMWAEVKPIVFDIDEMEKVELLVKEMGFPVLKLIGVPARETYFAIEKGDNNSFFECEYCLSNYHNYPKEEGRFYGMPSEGEIDQPHFEDIEKAVGAARSKRFEFENNIKEVKKNDI